MADKTSREYVICPCRGVTRGEVEDAIRKNRITDLKVLCQTTNAGTKCGGCREDLEKLQKQANSSCNRKQFSTVHKICGLDLNRKFRS